MLRVKKKYKEPPMEMLIWDVIEDISPLYQWDGDLYNKKYQDVNVLNAPRPYKKIKRAMTREKVAKHQTKIDKEKEVRILAADECCKQDCLQHVDRNAIANARRDMECKDKKWYQGICIEFTCFKHYHVKEPWPWPTSYY